MNDNLFKHVSAAGAECGEKYKIKMVLGELGSTHTHPSKKTCLCSTESFATKVIRQAQLLMSCLSYNVYIKKHGNDVMAQLPE